MPAPGCNLLDKLMYITSRPLASRFIGRSHLEGLRRKDMAGYLKHRLEIAGIVGEENNPSGQLVMQ